MVGYLTNLAKAVSSTKGTEIGAMVNGLKMYTISLLIWCLDRAPSEFPLTVKSISTLGIAHLESGAPSPKPSPPGQHFDHWHVLADGFA